MANNNYETIFVCDVSTGEDKAKALIEKFTSLIKENGEITKVDEWGKRRLAYPINDLNEGYYVFVTFNAPTTFVAELERIYKITDGIMRSIVVKADPKASMPARAEKVEAPVVAEKVEEPAATEETEA